MNRELEIWRFAAERLRQKETVILLVVAESAGSSPGRQGFKMVVARDEMRGSVGGGVMEVRLVEQAKFRIQDSEFNLPDSEVVRQNHRRSAANPSGMICSGEQTVIFYKLNFGDLPTIRKIVRALRNHEVKVLQMTAGNFQVLENRSVDFDFRFEHQDDNDFLFREKLGFKNKLYIVGGGHCALALSELMSKLDFYIALFDDRPDLNTLAKNKFVHAKIILDNYENIDRFISSGANHYVVVMTVGYKFDEMVIRRLIDKNFKYFGVLGSRAKMAVLLKKLVRDGFAAESLNKLNTPIGLPINSRTPEEIAVSIAAEIISVKNAAVE